jgi:hypothetical protein
MRRCFGREFKSAMAVLQLVFLAAPLAGVLLLSRVNSEPECTLPSHPTLVYCYLLSIQIVLAATWRVIIQPLFFSAYRDIPEPSVRALSISSAAHGS